MFDYIKNIRVISSFHGEVKSYGEINARASHGFIIKLGGSTDYFFGDKHLCVKEGEMIFLPKGVSYKYSKTEQENNLYISINFEADFENAEPAVYSLDNFHGASHIFQSFSEQWRFGDASDKYKCQSVFFDLLSYVSKIEHLQSLDKNRYHLIDPAVEYMKKHIYDGDFKINALHKLCGISDTYFRRIFESRFNMTPQEYVVKERISLAKSVIESGDYMTIGEVAESVGYNDPLYFSKAFKKIYGYSPSKINKKGAQIQ